MSSGPQAREVSTHGIRKGASGRDYAEYKGPTVKPSCIGKLKKKILTANIP